MIDFLGKRSFCVLVKDTQLKEWVDIYQFLPAKLIPTYDRGHIVLWRPSSDSDESLKLRNKTKRLSTQIPLSWGESVLCSWTTWKKILFEEQLKHLIDLAKENHRKRSGSSDEKKEDYSPRGFSGLRQLISQAASAIRHVWS
jgi:hypothetical protein